MPSPVIQTAQNAILPPLLYYLEVKTLSLGINPYLILHQNEAYKYLGIHLTPTLKWNIQLHATMTKLNEQCKLLRNYDATMKQKIHITESVIRVGIAYGFYAMAFLLPTINKFNKIITRLYKSILGVPCNTPNVTTQLPYENFGLGAFSLRNTYLRCIGEQLRDALNDLGKLGTIYQELTKYIAAKIGGAQHIPRITKQSCVQSPITRTLYLLKKFVGAHIRSINEDLPLQRIQLEELWFT